MELRAQGRIHPVLNAKRAIPCDAFKERIDESHQDEGGGQLGLKPGPLGDASGYDGGYGCSKSQKKKNLTSAYPFSGSEVSCAGEEIDAVGDAVSNEKIGDGGGAEIGENLHQCVDLILLANRAQFEESKPGVHRQYQDCSEQHEQDITAGFRGIHEILH